MDQLSAEISTPKPRKHVTSACHSCKTGKVKCDGHHPCGRCVTRDITCAYRSDEDGRSRVSTKRKIEQLQHDNALLLALVDDLRAGDDLQLRRIVSLIRSNASLYEIHESLSQLRANAHSNQETVNPIIQEMHVTAEAALQRRSSTDPMTPASQASSDPPSRFLSVHRLVDEPTHRVNAAPWTKVTSDDYLVSHLLSLWATWDHLFPDGIVLELFLRDMRAGNLSCHFCSPFLVNCVLAAGCLHSDHDEAKTIQGTASDLSSLFIKEAKIHLEREQKMPSITNVQGLGILYMAVSKMCQDREGYHFAIQTATLGAELSRARDRIIKTAATVQAAEELALVLDITCWGVFSSTTASMMGLRRPQNVDAPKQAYPDVASIPPAYRTTRWSPYPRIDKDQAVNLDEVCHDHANLAVLTTELTRTAFTDRKDGQSALRMHHLHDLHDLHSRLHFWKARLAEQGKRASTDCPAVLTLHMWWHGVILTLLRAKISLCLLIGEPMEGGSGFRPEDNRSDTDPRPLPDLKLDQHQLLEQALDIVRLARLHSATYGYSRLNCFICHPVYLALYVLFECNSHHDYDLEVTELCTTIHAASRRFPFAFSLLRMIHIDVRQRALKLPVDAVRLLDDFESHNLTSQTKRRLPNSMYPSPNSLIGDHHVVPDDADTDAQPTNMGEFLLKFDKLIVEDG